MLVRVFRTRGTGGSFEVSMADVLPVWFETWYNMIQICASKGFHEYRYQIGGWGQVRVLWIKYTVNRHSARRCRLTGIIGVLKGNGINFLVRINQSHDAGTIETPWAPQNLNVSQGARSWPRDILSIGKNRRRCFNLAEISISVWPFKLGSRPNYLNPSHSALLYLFPWSTQFSLSMSTNSSDDKPSITAFPSVLCDLSKLRYKSNMDEVQLASCNQASGEMVTNIAIPFSQSC